MDFQTARSLLGGPKGPDGNLLKVTHLQDPFGNSYGYSTAAARQEDDFKAEALAKGKLAKRATPPVGINPNFDLWSTGGQVTTGTVTDSDRNGWIKNW